MSLLASRVTVSALRQNRMLQHHQKNGIKNNMEMYTNKLIPLIHDVYMNVYGEGLVLHGSAVFISRDTTSAQ